MSTLRNIAILSILWKYSYPGDYGATIREIPVCLLVHIIACLLLAIQSHCYNKGYNIIFSESDQFMSKLILHVYKRRVCVLVQ